MYRLITGFCALFILGTGANAQVLDLKQAYIAARTYDAAMLSAEAAAQAGREVLPQARAQLLPNVTASVSRTNNNLFSQTPNFFGNTTEARYSYPSSSDVVTLRQPIYRKYQWAQYQQAGAQVQEVEATLKSEVQNLALRVTGAYMEALLAEDQARLIESQVQSRRANLDAATRMFASGAGTRTDVDDAKARLDMALAQDLEARQNMEYTRQQLGLLVGRPVNALAPLQPKQMTLKAPEPAMAEMWIEMAEQSSQELAVLRARLDAAGWELEKTRAGHFPTLDATLQWSRTSSENVTNVESRYENRSVGLQLNIPVFSGGGASAAVRQATAGRERAQLELERVRRELGIRVRKEYRNVTEGLQRIQALEQALRSADLSVDSTQKSLAAGVRTRLDVLNAQDNRLAVLRDLAQSRYVYLMSGLRLSALTNAADQTAIETLNSVFQ